MILHQLQFLLIQVLRLRTKVHYPLYQILIYVTIVLLQLYQFQDTIQSMLVYESSYITSIKAMKMRLLKLQNNDKKARKLRSEKLSEDWKDTEKVIYYQSLLYISKVICFKLINKYYDNPLIGYFRIEKTQKLIT